MLRLRNRFHSHKKQIIILVVVLATLLCGGVAAVILGSRNEERSSEKDQLKISFSAEDLTGIVQGLDQETYVLAGSRLDLLSLLSYDDSIVIKAAADELDFSAPANLEAKYTFTVNAKALCAFLGRKFPKNGMTESVIVAFKKIIVVDSSTARDLENADTVVYHGTETMGTKPDHESILPDNPSKPTQSENFSANSEPAGNKGNAGYEISGSSGGSKETSSNTETEVTPHTHTWVCVSPENSWHMEYGAACRIHGYNGEEPMFFRSQNDLFLHHAADGCNSGWGAGFKGLAYKYCTGCGKEVITGHVHDFGTIAKEIYSEKVVCECGMSFNAGEDYTAIEAWNAHVEIYTSHGDPKGNHDSYQTVKTSVTRYEATKTCTCGWRPIDNSPIY